MSAQGAGGASPGSAGNPFVNGPMVFQGSPTMMSGPGPDISQVPGISSPTDLSKLPGMAGQAGPGIMQKIQAAMTPPPGQPPPNPGGGPGAAAGQNAQAAMQAAMAGRPYAPSLPGQGGAQGGQQQQQVLGILKVLAGL
jgi:hypothetical protein